MMERIGRRIRDLQAEFREMHIYDVDNTFRLALQTAAREVFGSHRRLAVMFTIALFAGLIGPFGTFEGQFAPERYLYWMLIVAGTALPAQFVFVTFRRFFGETAWRDVFWIVFASVVAGVPVFCVVYAVAFTFGARLDIAAAATLYLQCVGVIIAVATALHLVEGRSELPSEGGADIPLLARLPGALRGRLIRLTAQDHYVEVVTDRGRHLLALRLRDAMAEVGTVDGAQVHRSHWVALDAVQGCRRVKGTAQLQLVDGSKVPVGRTFLRKAREAGVVV